MKKNKDNVSIASASSVESLPQAAVVEAKQQQQQQPAVTVVKQPVVDV